LKKKSEKTILPGCHGKKMQTAEGPARSAAQEKGKKIHHTGKAGAFRGLKAEGIPNERWETDNEGKVRKETQKADNPVR